MAVYRDEARLKFVGDARGYASAARKLTEQNRLIGRSMTAVSGTLRTLRNGFIALQIAKFGAEAFGS